MIRVGRCVYENGQRIDPSYPGFTPILVLTKSNPYASLSPYCLKDEQGRIMESIFQFSKVYETVPATTCRYSRYDSRIIWQWPAERHTVLNNGVIQIQPEYLKWRHAGMNASEAIRYPVGFNHRHKCLFSLKETNDPVHGPIIDPTPLNYIESRKQIYYPI